MLWFILLLAGQTTTDCSTIGNITRCTTQDPVGSAAQPLIDNMNRQNEAAERQRESQLSAAEASENRRAIAYAQVGELIAKGDCDGARRLAKFYNRGTIIKDTERACEGR